MSTKPVVTAALAVFVAGLALTAWLLLRPGGFATADTIGPAGEPEADFKTTSVSLSYTDTGAGPGTPGNPIEEVPVGEEFRVRVDFTFHNNGPDEDVGTIRVVLTDLFTDLPTGCVPVDPASGTTVISTSELDPPEVPTSVTFSGFAELKVRCDATGPKTFTATVGALPETAFDPEFSNDEMTASSTDPITVTGDDFIKGDVNCDSVVDISDSVYLLNQLLLGPPTGVPIPCPNGDSSAERQVGGLDDIAGDINCDGSVTEMDLLFLLKHAGDLTNDFPPGCAPIGAALAL